MWQIVKRSCGAGIFSKWSKIYSTDLVFKIDAIDGKKWVKYVAMQQNSETLIYDVNSVKGIKQYSSKPEKLHLVRKVFQRKP